MPSTRSLLCGWCLLLVVLAGCIGGPTAGDAPSPTTTTDDSPSPTTTTDPTPPTTDPTPTTTTDPTPPTTDPTPTATTSTGRPEEMPDYVDIVQFSELSPTQQRAFNQSLRTGGATLLDGWAWGVPDSYFKYHEVVGEDAWPGPEYKKTYVRRGDRYYQVTFSQLECCIGPAKSLSLQSIDAPGNRSVVDLDDRSGGGWKFVKHTIETGGFARGWRVDVPVERGTVIEYQGEYYEVEGVSVADFGHAEMTVVPVR